MAFLIWGFLWNRIKLTTTPEFAVLDINVIL